MRALPLIAIIAATVTLCRAQNQPAMRPADEVRIREAMRITGTYGDRIWQGMSKAPFAILLVTDSAEFLVDHPNPSGDFARLGEDRILHAMVYYRKAVFNRHLLATFPAVNGLNTIVVGTPENTGKNTTAWIITLLHEHFHQFVYSSPGYYKAVGTLDLAGGDSTGMWMLNYPFPYADSTVDSRYARYAQALLQAVNDRGGNSFSSSVKAYAADRKRLREALDPPAYRYLSLQIWQEGIARYTEEKFLELMGDYSPSKEVRDLPDFIPFATFRTTFLSEQLGRVSGWALNEHRRDCFYAVGLAEGLVLDALNPGWRANYLNQKFYVERYAAALTE